jgi:hypothetical protein
MPRCARWQPLSDRDPCDWLKNPASSHFLRVLCSAVPFGSTRLDFLAIMAIMALSKKGGELWA